MRQGKMLHFFTDTPSDVLVKLDWRFTIKVSHKFKCSMQSSENCLICTKNIFTVLISKLLVLLDTGYSEILSLKMGRSHMRIKGINK